MQKTIKTQPQAVGVRQSTTRDQSDAIIKAGIIRGGMQTIDLQQSRNVLFKNYLRKDWVEGRLTREALDATRPQAEADDHIYIDSVTGESNININLENLVIGNLTIKTLKNTTLNGNQINCANVNATGKITTQDIDAQNGHIGFGTINFLTSTTVDAHTVTATEGNFDNVNAFIAQTNQMIATIQAALQTIGVEQVTQNDRLTALENRAPPAQFQYIVGQLIPMYRVDVRFLLDNGQYVALMNGQPIFNCQFMFPELWNLPGNLFQKSGADLILPDLTKENVYLTSGKSIVDTSDWVGSNTHTNTYAELAPHTHDVITDEAAQLSPQTVLGVKKSTQGVFSKNLATFTGTGKPYNIQPKSFKSNIYIVLGEPQM